MSAERIPLTRWTWRAFVATTLGPLLLVEVVLLAAYLTAVLYGHARSVDALDEVSRSQVRERVGAEAAAVRARLDGVEQQLKIYAAESRRALASDHELPPAEIALYEQTEGGAYVLDDPPPGRSSVFYSGIRPIDRDKAHRTARLDPIMHDLVEQNDLIAQVYLNTDDSLNRIYPPIEVDTYPAAMDIPSYNFYYLADEAHNPERGVVWTDAYLDPAGAGWILSAIHPVYAEDTGRLEGVVGFDITLQALVDGVLDLDLPWGGYAVLVDSEGALLALPPAGESDFGVVELTGHDYDEAVLEDTPKPAEYDLFGRSRTRELGVALSGSDHGTAEIDLEGSRLVAWERVEGPGWWLVIVVPTEAVHASADAIQRHTLRLGVVLVAGVLVFYAVFLAVLYWTVRRRVHRVAGPIEALRSAARAIAEGEHDQPPVHSTIEEIDELASDVLAMGRTLGEQLDRVRSQDEALRASAQREAAARAAAEARSNFLAHVSHEIRTPMNGLIGTLDLLQDDGASPDQQDALLTARRSADALLGLINDLLMASRSEHGEFELEEEPFDLAGLLRDLAGLFRPVAHEAGLTLDTRVEIGPDHAVGDILRVRQVVTNLLSNALKFTHEGGVTLTATRAGDEVQITVSDTGIGIPEGRLDAIFDAFAQADASTTRRYGGTGLGLTISSALVRRMGGELSVQSTEGEGSTFSFAVRLPPAVEPVRASEADASDAGASLDVLVADDNAVNRAIVQRMLERLGHTSVMVQDGEQAVRAASERPFDLILLDVHMPVMDGRTAVAILRDQEATRDVPILALTASVMDEDVQESLRAGFDEVVAKPITLGALGRALTRHGSGDRRAAS